MTEVNQKIMDMILENATVNEISSVTGLTNKQLFYRFNMLKQQGYNLTKKYYHDGEIVYNLCKSFQEKDISLITSPNETEFKAVFISDLHLSSIYDRVDLLDQVYDFCVREGIHVIINCGDLLDGFVGNMNNKKFDTSEKQIEYLLKKYPYDKNILNFVCLGNHDYSILENSGYDLENILLSKRHDIVSLGYGIGKLKIKNDVIVLKHPKTTLLKKNNSVTSGLVLSGHGHRSKTEINGNLINVHLASLSNVCGSTQEFPGFVKANISFNNGLFYMGYFEQFVFIDKFYKVNQNECFLGYRKKEVKGPIKYEEDRIPYDKEKIMVKNKVEN